MQNPIRVKLPADRMYKETLKAYCFHLGNEPKTGMPHRFAIPKSQVRDFKIVDGVCDFWIPEWLLKENGLQKYKNTDHEPTLF